MTADKRVLAAGAAIAVAAGFTPVAEAQTVRGALNSATAESNFSRDRNVSVRQRPREGYEARGLRLGAFTAFPKIGVTLEHNDNIYAAPTNEIDDLVWKVQPEVSVVSGWSRHALSAYGRMTVNRYQDNGSEDTEDYAVGAAGRIDVLSSTAVNLGADWARLTEPRTSSSSPQASESPIQYDLTSANVSLAREFNRLQVSGRYDFRDYDYEDGRTFGGAVIEQDDRDRQVHAVTARADYAISPATALFVEVSRNWREYRLSPPDVVLSRDSQGMMALVGANFELGATTRGEIGVGYLSQDYDDPSFNELDGFGARASVEWFPTQLTTVTFTGSRTVEDSGIVGSAGYLSTNLGAQIDHELLRNVILTGQAGYGNDDYEGIAREDDRVSAGLSATYLLNRNAGVTVGYTYFDQKSDGAAGGNDFTVNKVGATLTLQF